MRSPKSRSRGKSNRNRSNQGNIVNRVFDSSGPEGKVRGTPQQIIDKYTQLARDAFLANDRVAAENFQQHAEHYLRLLGEANREAEARRQQAEEQAREREAREREAREARDARRAENAPKPAAQPEAPAGAEVIEPEGSEEVLVETPESKPESKPTRSSGRSRRTRKRPAEGGEGDAQGAPPARSAPQEAPQDASKAPQPESPPDAAE